MNKILVVNVNWLGDAVFSTPFFKTLKDNFPKAHIACLCVSRVQKVLEFCPFIDEIIIYDEKKEHYWPWSKWALIGQLRSHQFDTAFLLHRSITRGLMVFLAGIPQRIGYCKSKYLMTHPVNFKDEDTHRIDVYLKILESYGLQIKDRACRLDLNSDLSPELDAILRAKEIDPHEKMIVLHTTGNWDLKRWPAEHFARLIKRITEQLKTKVILSGAKNDLEYCQNVNNLANHKAIVLAGETNLGQSLLLYRRSLVLISSDSGPLHLANSVGANVIGIYGPTRPEITGPRGKGIVKILSSNVGCNKAPCYYLACTNNICMQKITIDHVFEAIQTFIR